MSYGDSFFDVPSGYCDADIEMAALADAGNRGTVARSVSQEAFRFFFEHAGYASPPGRAACALDLARAESLLTRATDLGVASVEWVDDDMPYDPGDADSPEDVARYFAENTWTGPFGCIVRVFDSVEYSGDSTSDALESLWGIVLGSCGTNDPYARVVAAELASEFADDLRQAIGDALDARESSTGSEVHA